MTMETLIDFPWVPPLGSATGIVQFQLHPHAPGEGHLQPEPLWMLDETWNCGLWLHGIFHIFNGVPNVKAMDFSKSIFFTIKVQNPWIFNPEKASGKLSDTYGKSQGEKYVSQRFSIAMYQIARG